MEAAQNNELSTPTGPAAQDNIAQKLKNQYGQMQKIHAKSFAENTSSPHDVGRPSAAAIMW